MGGSRRKKGGKGQVDFLVFHPDSGSLVIGPALSPLTFYSGPISTDSAAIERVSSTPLLALSVQIDWLAKKQLPIDGVLPVRQK